MDIGYTLMGEQRGPRALVDDAVAAEGAGFDFLVASDHFSPWLEEQGHSPYTWSVLGAVAARTTRIPFMTFVTCPFRRYHPTIVAQKAATVSLLSRGRFSLGLGAGELLNEHVVGGAWPPADIRQEMLRESAEIIQALFGGGFVNYRGRHLTAESAKLYDPPESPLPIGVAAGGRQAARLAAELGADLIATEPSADLVGAYRDAGGHGKVIGQLPVCWAADSDVAAETLRNQFRWATSGWKVQSELPGTAAFDAASQTVRLEDLADSTVHGPQPADYVDGARRWADAGFTGLAFVQVGQDQRGFLDFWRDELAAELLPLRRQSQV